MANELINNEDFFANEFSVVFGPDKDKKMPASYFLSNYKSIMKRYISDGNPSLDTINSYCSTIDQFLDWCKKVSLNPFMTTEQHIMYYRSILVNKNYRSTSIKFKLTCLRRFFFVAIKYDMIKDNPVQDVHAHRDPDNYMPVLQFLSVKQLNDLITSIKDDDEKSLRDKSILYLMSIEGLRTIEVYRMNTQDINFELNTIYIRGKGHNDMIYPTKETMDILNKYINVRTSNGSYPTPVFTSTSNRSKGQRLSRRKIRDRINILLVKAGVKHQGKACHLLRHTCGTLLYSKTKDLQVVKQVLRHRNIEMTSRYSHVQDGMLKRYTSAISLELDKENNKNE